jgi:hypothetical protein
MNQAFCLHFISFLSHSSRSVVRQMAEAAAARGPATASAAWGAGNGFGGARGGRRLRLRGAGRRPWPLEVPRGASLYKANLCIKKIFFFIHSPPVPSK